MGIKDALFQLFLFLFQPNSWFKRNYTGLATIIALFFDAITDPWVGTSLIDGGRKNTEETSVYVCSGLSSWTFTFLTFYTPQGLEEFGLFLWLCFFPH